VPAGGATAGWKAFVALLLFGMAVAAVIAVFGVITWLICAGIVTALAAIGAVAGLLK
jgi:hypothetical protein